MLLNILRAIFLLSLSAVAMSFIGSDMEASPGGPLLTYHKDVVLLGCIGLGLVIIGIDLFIPQKSLGNISGLFFGLVVGMVIAYGLCLIVNLLTETFFSNLRQPVWADSPTATWELVPNPDDPTQTITRPRSIVEPKVVGYRDTPFVSAIKLMIGVICCYLAVSFILQTKDDVRFVIPYVEFTRQTKGGRPWILDTSVIIDGRIADLTETKFLDSELIIPRFVLQELQTIADSQDKLKRNRGRRGLDMLNKLQAARRADIRILDTAFSPREAAEGVDEKLVTLAKKMDGRVVTNDYNLNKIAQLRGAEVLNINDLANALKPVFLPGESMTVKVIKPGEGVGQGVGYLEDGTMVVVEGGRDLIGQSADLVVTSVLQTSAGRMIFGRTEGAEPRRPRPQNPR